MFQTLQRASSLKDPYKYEPEMSPPSAPWFGEHDPKNVYTLPENNVSRTFRKENESMKYTTLPEVFESILETNETTKLIKRLISIKYPNFESYIIQNGEIIFDIIEAFKWSMSKNEVNIKAEIQDGKMICKLIDIMKVSFERSALYINYFEIWKNSVVPTAGSITPDGTLLYADGKPVLGEDGKPWDGTWEFAYALLCWVFDTNLDENSLKHVILATIPIISKCIDDQTKLCFILNVASNVVPILHKLSDFVSLSGFKKDRLEMLLGQYLDQSFFQFVKNNTPNWM